MSHSNPDQSLINVSLSAPSADMYATCHAACGHYCVSMRLRTGRRWAGHRGAQSESAHQIEWPVGVSGGLLIP